MFSSKTPESAEGSGWPSVRTHWRSSTLRQPRTWSAPGSRCSRTLSGSAAQSHLDLHLHAPHCPPRVRRLGVYMVSLEITTNSHNDSTIPGDWSWGKAPGVRGSENSTPGRWAASHTYISQTLHSIYVVHKRHVDVNSASWQHTSLFSCDLCPPTCIIIHKYTSWMLCLRSHCLLATVRLPNVILMKNYYLSWVNSRVQSISTNPISLTSTTPNICQSQSLSFVCVVRPWHWHVWLL